VTCSDSEGVITSSMLRKLSFLSFRIPAFGSVLLIYYYTISYSSPLPILAPVWAALDSYLLLGLLLNFKRYFHWFNIIFLNSYAKFALPIALRNVHLDQADQLISN